MPQGPANGRFLPVAHEEARPGDPGLDPFNSLLAF
jgi:hypothetical protein